VQLGGEPGKISIGLRPVRAGGSRRPFPCQGTGARVNDITERQAEHTLEQRVDSLLARVHAARAEIVDRGLDAVRVDREHRAGAGEPA
jgi:hypothetical protein